MPKSESPSIEISLISDAKLGAHAPRFCLGPGFSIKRCENFDENSCHLGSLRHAMSALLAGSVSRKTES